MRHPLRVSLCVTPLLFCATGLASPGEVWVVDDGGGADFTQVQPAIDAAAQQDTILIRPGNYDGFHVDNKALTLAADGAQPPRIQGPVLIENLGGGRPLSVAGLNLRAGFRVRQCLGEVLFSDCMAETPGLTPVNQSLSHLVQDCEAVVFSRCTLRGRDGGSDPLDSCNVLDAMHGENGLDVESSRVALYGSSARGGRGGESWDGWCLFCIDATEGNGGDGIRASGSSELYLDDVSANAGLKGPNWDNCGSGPAAHDGQAVALLGAAQLTQAADPILKLASPTVVREDAALTLTVEGPAGATAMLLWSDDPDWRFLGTTLGVLHLGSANVHVKPLGTIPGSGTLTVAVAPPAVLGNQDARRLSVQVFAIASQNGRLLGTPASLDVLDPAF